MSHDWMRSTYYVRPLHPTLKYLMWDFDSLSKEQEEYYINAKFSMMKTSPTLNVSEISSRQTYYKLLIYFRFKMK